MPIPAALNSAWEVRLEGLLEGQKTENVFHFVCVGATADVELNLILVFVTCFLENMLPVLSAQWSFQRVVYKQVSPTLGLENIYTTDLPASGGAAGAQLPSYVSALFSEHTTFAGRSGRGRKYFAGIPEAATIGSALDPTHAFWAGALAFAACVISAFVHPDPAGGTDLFDLSVYSRIIGGSAFPYGASGFHAVTSMVPSPQTATTRSRKVGRGA